MASSLSNNVLTERVIQLETNVANLQESVNSAIGTMMSKIDEVLQKMNVCVTPTPNSTVIATSPTAASLSLLELAARGDCDAILRLLKDQADSSNLNKRAENGDTALHIQAREGHLGAVRILLGTVGKLDDPGYFLRTPLHCAAAHGHLNVVQCFLNAGAQVDARDADGKTPLALAAENGHTEIVDLLAQGVTRHSQTNLQIESLSHTNLVQYLKENGVAIESSNSKGLVIQAAKSGRWEIVVFLLERGLSATECKDPQECALVLAARAGQADAVSLLLRRGAAADAQQVKCGLEEAKSAAVVWVFLEVVPDAVRGGAGEEALIEAAWCGRLEPLAALLDLGIDINCKDGDDQTALWLAAANGHIACVKELLRRGADVNIKDKAGWTALHGAAGAGREGCVRALLEAGASKAVMNNNGKTPLQTTNSKSIRPLFNTVA